MRYEGFLKHDQHIHSSLCGGRDTHEQMVRAAIDRGMCSIGFSEHSRVSFAPSFGMSEADETFYRKEILRLREKYHDRIHIYRGIEQDFYSDLPPLGYDYVIGSVHYLRTDGLLLPITGSADQTRAIVKKYFGGDVFAYLRLYFETVAELPRRTACDVIGHFGLVAQANGDGSLFDERDHFYRGYAYRALDALLEQDMIFEINTKYFVGARKRGFYPSLEFLRYIAERGGRFTFSSDSTEAEGLTRGFEFLSGLCRCLGVSFVYVFSENGWERIRA